MSNEIHYAVVHIEISGDTYELNCHYRHTPEEMDDGGRVLDEVFDWEELFIDNSSNNKEDSCQLNLVDLPEVEQEIKDQIKEEWNNQ